MGSRFQQADGMNDVPRKDPMLGRSPLLPLLAVAGFALFVDGCSSQADTSYRGTALAQLHGTVQTSATSPVQSPAPALEAALLWSGLAPGDHGKVVSQPARQEVAASVPVSGQFPAQFVLDIYLPPPDASLFSCFASSDPSRPGKMASGSIAAILQGSAATVSSITDLYGFANDFYVAYVDSDLPAVSDCPGGALTKGYHLFKYTPTPDKPGCVRQAPDDTSCNGPWPYTEVGMTTDLTLVLSHEDGKATPPPTPTPPPGTSPAPTPP